MGPKSFIKYLFENPDDQSVEIAFIKNGIYTNLLLGVRFKIPEKWHIVQMDKFREMGSKQKFQGIYEDFKKGIIDYFGNPLLICTKYDPDSKDHDGIVTPTINFNVIPKTGINENISLSEYTEGLSLQADIGYDIVKEFQIVSRGPVYTFQDHDFIKYETEYLFEHEELEEGIKVELDIINIELEDFFLDFSMTQCKVQGEIAVKEFDEVIKSILIDS